MRERIIAFLLTFLFVTPVSAAAYRAALVADMDSGRVLIQENANDLNYPASLTKIMTLYLTFDALQHGRLHLDDYLIVSQSAANADPVKLGLVAGSKISVEDAIKAVAVVSANDVARVLAENLKGGKEGNFADLMTRVANEIGLSRTNFENSSGLPNDDHMSTAHDIALLAVAVYRHYPQYWKYFGIKNWTYNGKTYTNGNRLLGTYPGCDGMKTGFTNKSKYSLVATASRDGHHLISVVLGAENKDVRANVSTDMLNRGFKMLGTNMTGTITKNTPVSAVATTGGGGMNKPVVNINSASQTQPKKTQSSGTYGVQFGAFASQNAAQTQQARVTNVLGITPGIEPGPNGMFRVRINGLAETDAQKLKSNATSNGIDSFVFH